MSTAMAAAVLSFGGMATKPFYAAARRGPLQALV